jgi:ABC-2 type transport system ATP-binding protein
MDVALECRDVSKEFAPSGRGVFDVSFRVARGSGFALLGDNGCGKTTLINVCLGFLEPDQGTVTVQGIDIREDPMGAKLQIAYVPEVVRLYSHLNAFDHLRYFDGLMGLGRRENLYEEVLEKLGLPRYVMGEPTRNYSKGMRQKIAIAMGLLKGAEMFLLDEPTSGLDSKSSREFARVINALKVEGKAVLFSSHDATSVELLADRFAVLRDGRVSAEGRVDELRSRWTGWSDD